jgi:hypothetical protein
MGIQSRVEARAHHILKKLEHIGAEEIKAHSAKWLAAMATIDAEIAQIVTRLAKAHPHVPISSVTGRNIRAFFCVDQTKKQERWRKKRT